MSKIDRIKLEPCPFCDGEADFVERAFMSTVTCCVRCIDCGAESKWFKVSFDTCAAEEAAAAWNRRANTPVRRGHWEDCSNGWMCSNCLHDSIWKSKFCPNCGADMRRNKNEVN